MRIFTRYILAEVFSHAVLGGVLFTFVLFMRIVGKLLELLVNGSASIPDAGRMILYTLPEFLTVTIPMAVLVGILLGLSRLASDSEITAMRASGISALAFVRIISILATAALALGLVNTLYFEPKGAANLLALEDSLKTSQGTFEVQPRVFYENFKNYVLYVQDVRPVPGAALWRHVFLADLTQPASPSITTAGQALVTSGGKGILTLHLSDGSQHQISAANPDQYNISTFLTTDLPMQAGAQDDTHISRNDTSNIAIPLPRLLQLARTGSGSTPAQIASARPFRIEFNRRFSYPFACLVLMLVGVPLGLSSKRGGKSTGFVLTILLVFVYYFLSSVGVALAKQGKLQPVLGVWGANILFAAAGALLLQQMSRGGVALSLVSSLGVSLTRTIDRLRPGQLREAQSRLQALTSLQRFREFFRVRFPLILDDYIMRLYGSNFALVLGSLSTLFLIFTFFELIGDIIRNRTPLVTVGDYLLNLIPYILYNVTPLCSLVAVLITFGALSKSSELTAMKSSGLSLYRIVAPVLALTLLISAGLFVFDDLYLPAANRRQEALRAEIKGKPAQTFLRPDRKWISGQASTPSQLQTVNAGGPARIFYYQFFDPDKNVFANLTVFELDPKSFTLTRRIFAASARWDDQVDRWVFENGWQRTFSGETTASYRPFTLSTFPEIHETPTYFKKEDRQSQEMSFGELSRYIADLRQSGFDTKRLSVQLNRKISYPAITLVMAFLAIPFALVTGKRGGVAGFAVAILIAIAYIAVANLFEAMGNVNTLPPALAAWTPDALFAFAGAWFLLRTPT
jgi:LPS export ABC transporter permease LptG/LPS export ABC transporter permease LptF